MYYINTSLREVVKDKIWNSYVFEINEYDNDDDMNII